MALLLPQDLCVSSRLGHRSTPRKTVSAGTGLSLIHY